MWVKLWHDFGLPYLTLTVGVRKLYNEGIRLEASTPEAIVVLAEDLRAYVVRHRPKLEGCRVVSISQRSGLTVDITVVHPSLPPVKVSEEGKRERLELCAACGKAMDADKLTHSVLTKSTLTSYSRELLVCDGVCAKKLSEPML